jgi:hypothetical protein
MNRTALKNYAPQARRDFIQAMTDRAAFYGITAKKVEPMTVKGDVVVIGGREYPKAIADKRNRLEERIQRDGFNQTIDGVAYSWFNRFVALRYMELHGYLEHGYRVLSHPEGKPFPEILEHAEHLDLPTLDKNTVIDLKLAGNKENELYRLLLLAQCNSLHASMPFLFEEINDETELLLPEGLLNSDSLIRKLVDGIAEEDWGKVEIIGWLYQFYIAEKKDEVIGSVVASEDIPAATQLFTPNWIVRYLVQNTLGRKWLATYPESSVRGQMEFYIEPAEQEPEVQAKLKEITPESLNPEEITFLDPACGSGHILVEAYDLFKAIYQERGYRTKDIPALILQKNLFGFEIDDRAAQLAMFALLMKARADDRRILESKVQPSIVCFVESKGFDPVDLANAINQVVVEIGSKNVSKFDIGELVELFVHAKTFGSLIQVPPKLVAKLPEIENRLFEVLKKGGLTIVSAQFLKILLQHADLLARQYDLVVANPPYMGSKGMNSELKDFAKAEFPECKTDLFAMFIKRGFKWCKKYGRSGMVTMQSWMFLSSLESMREEIINKYTLENMLHMGNGVMGIAFGTAASVFLNNKISSYCGTFSYCEESDLGADGKPKTFPVHNQRLKNAKSDDFKKIPGSPIAYWMSEHWGRIFADGTPLGKIVDPRVGLDTGNNDRFIFFWHEVDYRRIGFNFKNRSEFHESGFRYVPHTKGGAFRKWYGNLEFVLKFDIESFLYLEKSGNHLPSREFYFIEGVNWTRVSSSSLSIRYSPVGCVFNSACPTITGDHSDILFSMALLLSNLADPLIAALSPTINAQAGDIRKIPVLPVDKSKVVSNTEELISISKSDWDSVETSWDFNEFPLVAFDCCKISDAMDEWASVLKKRKEKIINLEENNNRLFIEAYGLQGELSPNVPDSKVTLWRLDAKEDIRRLISYFIGCTMGRYSLDKKGLIYAYSGSEGFEKFQHIIFPADDDGIVPLLNQDWGINDDASQRFVQFISVAWPKEHLEENLQFVAEILGGKPDEPSREVIRNYFSTGFYKHHLQLYKRRPIYWLFSSGKQKAFQALVYLHRYNEGTLSRMRTEYVIPLQGKISGRIEQLEADKLKVTSTSQRKKFQKEQDDLKKQQAELFVFDEKLKNYADQRINLNLDDGVKVNYAKFGDLLAEVKAVTGGSDE